MLQSDRADLYALLAETLAEPPGWMFLPGREWPLYTSVVALASEFPGASQHIDRLAGIPPEAARLRQERYAALFASGKPRFWLYESAALTGKILGPQTFELAGLYRAAGLETVGAELPDHISLELTFLSRLVGSPQEKGFLDRHAAWMIALGRALSRSGDQVYAPVGDLLADWLESALARISTAGNKGKGVRLPVLPDPDDCTLCGFCAQVCPTQALRVLEDARYTRLVLETASCVHCGKCEKVCEFHVLNMELPAAEGTGSNVLRLSPLVGCRHCGQPVVSQAELDYIVSQIGEAPWQHLCLDCRSGLYV